MQIKGLVTVIVLVGVFAVAGLAIATITLVKFLKFKDHTHDDVTETTLPEKETPTNVFNFEMLAPPGGHRTLKLVHEDAAFPTTSHDYTITDALQDGDAIRLNVIFEDLVGGDPVITLTHSGGTTTLSGSIFTWEMQHYGIFFIRSGSDLVWRRELTRYTKITEGTLQKNSPSGGIAVVGMNFEKNWTISFTMSAGTGTISMAHFELLPAPI